MNSDREQSYDDDVELPAECPKCHSEDVTWLGSNRVASMYKHFYQCEDCGHEWTEYEDRE